MLLAVAVCIFSFQAEDGIRDATVTGVQTCALPISLSLGAPAVEQAAFLEGLLPLVETPWLFPSIELAVGHEKGRVADLHFWRDEGAGDGTWVLLLEVTSERDATRRLQQKAYDMTLLQEREAALNRRLEAAQEELRAQSAEVARWNKTL